MGISKEAKQAYDRQRYQERKEIFAVQTKLWRKNNPEKYKAMNSAYFQKNKVEIRRKQAIYNQIPEVKAQLRKKVGLRHLQLKIDTFIHYSGGFWPSCNCCGESQLDFLTLDHINNDGAKHRKENNLKGAKIYYWLRTRGYPEGFQVLCWNCNVSKGLFGECPHKELVL